MIFISYRRSDSQAAAGRLHDRLAQHFQSGEVFLDVEDIEPGVDFVASLNEQLAKCDAFIAVIGPDWLATTGRDGARKLDDPSDYVRLELEVAIARDIRIIPVLVDGATMPAPADLPTSLQPLARRNAVILAHHRFTADCDELARFIRRTLGLPTRFGPGAEEGGKPLSWPEVLFSFRGRITRLQFVLGMLMVLAAMVAFIGTLSALISLTSERLDGEARETMKGVLALLEERTTTFAEIVMWWPVWALALKRLHDVGHGWKVFIVIVGVDVASVALGMANMKEIVTHLMVFTLGITFMLAAIQGNPGANRYGAAPARSPKPHSPGRSVAGTPNC